MTTEQFLAALLEVAPPELREVLTSGCLCYCHFEGGKTPGDSQPLHVWHQIHGEGACPHGCDESGRVTLPVPEATLAAMQWCCSHDGWTLFFWDEEAYLEGLGIFGGGPDIFAAIRAALEA